MSLGEWLTEETAPSRWHLVLLWVMTAFCAGFHAATGEPLLSVVLGG